MLKKINFSFSFLFSFLFSHGVSDSDKAEMISGGLLDYFILGAKHMVTGYDHIFIFNRSNFFS